MPSSHAVDISDQHLIHQQARQQALQVQLTPPPADVRPSVPEKAVSSTFPCGNTVFSHHPRHPGTPLPVELGKHLAGGVLGFNVSWQC